MCMCKTEGKVVAMCVSQCVCLCYTETVDVRAMETLSNRLLAYLTVRRTRHSSIASQEAQLPQR